MPLCATLSLGLSIHDPGPFTLALLQDIGWTTATVKKNNSGPAILQLLLNE